MSTEVYTHIKYLINARQNSHLLKGKELAELPVIEDAYLILEDGIIADFGPMQYFTKYNQQRGFIGAILPCWCDSHTHLVFSGSREAEFVDKIKGMSYAEIASKGGEF